MNPYDPLTPNSQTIPSPMLNLGSEIISTVNATATATIPGSKVGDEAAAVDAAKAKQTLKDWGFDPDDVSKGGREWYYSQFRPAGAIGYGVRESRPMILFAQIGDLSMLRYIWKMSEDPVGELSKTDEFGLFPLYTAISDPRDQESILEVCRFLYQRGASVQQTVAGEWSPLSRACLKGFRKVAEWLLASGALLTADGRFDCHLAKRDIPLAGSYNTGEDSLTSTASQIHRELFAWAEEILATWDTFFLVLAAVSLPLPSIETARPTLERILAERCRSTLSNASALLCMLPDSKLLAFLNTLRSPLEVFSGHPGIMEHIGGFVGVEEDRTILCTARGLVGHKVWWASSGEPWQHWSSRHTYTM